MNKPVLAMRTIPASLDAVWGVLANIGNTAVYNPVVFESAGDTTAEVGSTRRCQVNSSGSKWIEEEVIESGDHRYTIEIVGGNGAPPMRTTVEITAVPDGPDATRVAMEATLHPEGIVQRLLAVPGRRMMARVSARVLSGLEHHLVTGERVDASFK